MKRALVTGGSGQIGSAISRQLAQERLHVIVHAHRNLTSAQEVAEQITKDGGSASVACFDAADAHATQEGLAEIQACGQSNGTT
jgi:3-oxoacyl-[acyl-carrier protein] reductase